jgi:twitching motility protein PilI
LRLQLAADLTVLLPMADTQQVVVINTNQLTLMPNMPSMVMGLLNHRNRIVWVVDLAHLLELGVLAGDRPEYTVALIRVGRHLLGLAVQQVQGILRLEPERIQSPVGTVSASLTPYLRGCCLHEQAVLLILDAAAIAQCGQLQSVTL